MTTTAQRDQTRDQIRAAVSQLQSSDGFRAWIRCRARFHRYSAFNTYLIAAQCPDATHVAGYRAWQALGRQVRRGERAIHILAPIVVRDRDNPDARVVVGFRGASVFDVSQTDGEPLPTAPECIEATGDDLAHYLPALEGHARELGYVVYYYAPDSGALGFCDPSGMRIVISPELSPNARVTTLVHELAHAHGLTYREYSRAECETIVEATCAIVLAGIGFDTSRFTIPYIAQWAQDSAGLDALERFAGTIDKTARSLEQALGV